MTQETGPGQRPVTVRLFAAARDAAGTPTLHLALPAGATVADLVAALGALRPALVPVLQVSTVLVGGLRHRPSSLAALPSDASPVDVLPPFAGG